MKSKKTISKHDLEIIKNYCLLDDSFMEVCFNGNPNAVELVLRIILNKPDLSVIEVKIQDSLKNLRGRSVRMDILARDGHGTLYNIEIQRGEKGAAAKRARYHASLMDAGITSPGDDFEHLPELYVIFITESDVRGRNKAVYEFAYIDIESGEPLDYGTHILYVNNEFRDDSDIGKLMQDFAESDPDKMHYDVLAETARYYKEDAKGVADMYRVMDIKFNEGLREGKLEGAHSKAVELLKNLIESTGMNAEAAAAALRLSEDERDRCISELNELDNK
ncbi:MAG TPA: PD-(D/E)XK nuclease family transposase [Candidatus Ornithomonoglobus merdipullorum]|uniref:PD-(D/E)XK nuclease family transposase n=1 Tax=Candidatus Ornithomonoglobus merdipullorum TaxID=2840895 RepID=A0A9D1SF81_9FIRM|nr:PD-(D/E)XK nuclease family transposase [Candidatus Ornithomonoglobus merdipullorum]